MVMFNSLQSRLWLTYAVLILVVLAIIALGVFVYLVRFPTIDRQALQTLEVAARMFRRLYDPGSLRLSGIQRRLDVFSEQFSVNILVYDESGDVIFESDQGAVHIDFSKIRGRVPSRGIIRGQDQEPWLFNAQRLPDRNTLLLATPRQGGMALLRSPQGREILRDDILPPFIRAGTAALILAVLLAIWMSGWISSPIKDITAAARKVADGQYQQITPQGPDEVKTLGVAFNDMVRKVRSSQQSQRDFVANVSHELKTPLTSIQGFSQAILDGTVNSQKKVKEAAEVIHNEANRMYTMVLDLLELARFDAGTVTLDRQEVDLNAMLSRLVRNLRLRAEEAGINLTLAVDVMPAYWGDPDRLAQVFSNILDNALKYTPAGGEVKVAGSAVEGRIEIDISDDGPGIPEEEVPRVFDRFYQVDKSRAGDQQHSAGLGLAIAREIVQAHGGELSLLSEVGLGSQFRVILPRKEVDRNGMGRGS